jgi:hypothetical protein
VIRHRQGIVGCFTKLINKGEDHIVVNFLLSEFPFAGLVLVAHFAETLDITFSTSNELLPRSNGGKREEGVDAEAKVVVRSAVNRKVNINCSISSKTESSESAQIV